MEPLNRGRSLGPAVVGKTPSLANVVAKYESEYFGPLKTSCVVCTLSEVLLYTVCIENGGGINLIMGSGWCEPNNG